FPVQTVALSQILGDALAVFIAPCQIALGTGQALFRGGTVPPHRLLPALLHPLAALVQKPQAALGVLVLLLGRLPVPIRGSRRIQRDTPAPLTAEAHTQLSPGIVLLRSAEIQPGRLRVVLLHALAMLIAPSQVAQGPGIVLLRSSAVPPHRLLPVLLHALAALIQEPQAALARRVAVLRRSAVPFHRLLDTLGQAGAELQATPQFCLRRGITQPRGGLIPAGGLLVALLHSQAAGICLPQQELGPGKAVFRPLSEALHRFGIIPRHTDAMGIAVSQVRQGGHIVPGGGLGVQHHRLPGVCRHADPRLQAPPQVRHTQHIIQGRRLLVAGQRVRRPLLIHGPVAQLHPVGPRQLLFVHREEKGAPALGADIRFLLCQKPAVRVLTAIVIHLRTSSVSKRRFILRRGGAPQVVGLRKRERPAPEFEARK
ncbi:Phosphoribosylamine--glycine ligase, partial [Dysosmobacter welbionis]